MVYMAADNNLEAAAIIDLNEMEWIGSTSNYNVVVQLDRAVGYDVSNGNWETTRRYFVTLDQTYPTEITSVLIEDLGELNMGDPQTLSDFIEWSMSSYPAEKYFLILWDHGDGWRKSANTTMDFIASGEFDVSEQSGKLNALFEKGEPIENEITFPSNPLEIKPIKAMCGDETDKDRLYNNEIKSALSNFPKLDVLGFDACVMGMVEVAYEFKDQAYFLIASEESEPAQGWPYHYFLYDLYFNPTMSPSAMCSTVVYNYSLYDVSSSNNQTLSAVDLSQIDQVISSLNSFCSELINNGVWSEMQTYFPMAEQFGQNDPFYDLYDLANLAWVNLTGQGIINTSSALKSAIKNAVISEWHEYEHPNAHGLSICFPQSKYSSDAYPYINGDIDFIPETNWISFLQHYWGDGTLAYDFPEPNNYFTQSGLPLDPHYYYQSFISSLYDHDWWLINSGIDETIEINLDVPTNADFDIFLWDQNGFNILDASFNSGNGTDESISYHSPVPEYMYLHINQYSSFSTQPYTLRVSQTGNDKGWFKLSYDDNSPYSGYYSTTVGDVLGVTFNLSSYPMNIDRIWIYFTDIDGAGTGGDGSFYLLLWDNYGMILDPIEIGKLIPATTGWNYLDLTEFDIKAYTSFFLGVWYDGTNTACIGWDDYERGMDYYYSSSSGQWTYMEDALFFRVDVSYPVNYICGDPNNDGRANISDAVYIINYVFNGGTEPIPFEAGEVNCDGRVNISDAVFMINYVFVGGNDPCDTYPGSPNGDGIPDC